MDLHLDLESATGSSLRARVEQALRAGIGTGLLAPGTRLPPSRALCAQLGVSRGVVVDAYGQLVAEGYLTARRGAGTVVADAGPERSARTAPPPPPAAVRHDLSPFVPALSGFPRTAWRAAVGRVLREVPDDRLGLPDGAGVYELRAALASYLGRSRGVRTTPDQIVVTNGMRQGLGLLWAALAAEGAQSIAAETPGWNGVTDTATDAGLSITEITVDGDGFTVDELSHQVDVAVVAPAHQFPTGAVLSPQRRAALVAWARTTGALVVEDDYDAEYRYDRDPIGALQGLDPNHVVYGGSASKSLAPGIRLGWLAVPRRLAAPLAALQRRRGGMPASLHQLAMADLMQRGELDRHLRRQRRRYRRQRDALLRELAAKLPEVSVHGAAAGLFVVVHLPRAADPRAVLAAARAVGLSLEELEGDTPGLVVGYANLPEAAVGSAVDALAASVRAGLRTPVPA